MSDPDGHDPSATTVPASVSEILLALQDVDTQADQLRHRRAKSPLRDDLVAATTVMRTWELQRNTMRNRIDELGSVIEQAEARGGELQAQRARLEQQMKTVIAPREAEALMHELATVAGLVDQLDIEELEALEEQADIDDRLAAHLQSEEQYRTRLRSADDALAAETHDIDNELATLGERRAELRLGVSDSLLSTYDRKRSALGVAVAPLVGRQCQGCHLELSAAEIDTVKDEAAATGVTDCPDCGRILIVTPAG